VGASLVGLALVVGCSDRGGGDGDVVDASSVEAGGDVDVPSFEAGTAPSTTNILDRAGRAYTMRLVIPTSHAEGYNTVNDRSAPPVPFFVTANGKPPGLTVTYSQALSAQLNKVDMADGKNDWGTNDAGGTRERHFLTSFVLSDALLLDTTLPFSPTGFLEVEAVDLLGGTRQSCGGRWMSDDAYDKVSSFLIRRSLSGVSDGVNAATKPPSERFPYLAEPNL
jgi:hypothetical protein